MDFSLARGIADAVFYEGYLLYPYTATAPKNKLRWQFGVVVPVAREAAGTGEHGHQQTELLFESAGDAHVELRFRFLQIQTRTVEAVCDGAYRPVASLTVDETRHLTFDESVEREVAISWRPGAPEAHDFPIRFDGNRAIEELRAPNGALAGRVVRERWPLHGSLRLNLTAGRAASPAPPTSATPEPITAAPSPAVPDATHGPPGLVEVCRLRVRVENTSEPIAAAERGVVMRTAFVSAHTLIGITGGAFWSPIDPPDAALAQRLPTRNEHTWPVLVGDPTADEQRAAIVLSSPIVLSDFPAIAKNTNADAFDGTEIDELLNLSVLSLSDAERAEARATDPRARAIVERAEAFDADGVARTHATVESVHTQFPSRHTSRPSAAFDDVPVFRTPGSPADAAAPASVDIDGVTVRTGSSVRLAPKRRADAWDMFLAGKIATVRAIHQDFEDRIYVAVTVDDDPATEYHQWYGRSFFFEPDEVEPIGSPA